MKRSILPSSFRIFHKKTLATSSLPCLFSVESACIRKYSSLPSLAKLKARMFLTYGLPRLLVVIPSIILSIASVCPWILKAGVGMFLEQLIVLGVGKLLQRRVSVRFYGVDSSCFFSRLQNWMRDTKFGCMPLREKNPSLFPFLDARPYKKKNIPFSIFGSVTPFMKKNYFINSCNKFLLVARDGQVGC